MLKSKISCIKTGICHFSSALYITGDKAQKNFSALTPVIDFDYRLANKAKLIENIKLRQLSIDINKVEEKWRFYKEIDARKQTLENTKSEIGQTLVNLMKLESNETVTQEIEKLRLHLKIIKEDFKNLRNVSYSVEEGAVLQVLSLPNVLHPKTPHKEELQIYCHLEKPTSKSESHITIGHNKNYIKFINHMSCYLKSDAALLEFALQNYFINELLSLNYIQTSNSDFVKSIVVEGCGSDPTNNSEVLTLEDIHCIRSDEINKLHLVGASSLYSFMAYFTKHFVQTTHFPIKMFCFGRRYSTVKQSASENLFNLSQYSEIGMFIATLENPNILENIVDEIISLYKQLGYHFRIVLLPAKELKKSESLKLSIQMFSNHLGAYVEVGNVSFYEDYLSKRLLFNYSENKERKYVNVIGGSFINMQKVIGCVLENANIEQKSLLSDFLYNYIV